MSLTQQFLIISILPMSFLGMAAYLWRPGMLRHRALLGWTITLVAAAIWSSNVLRFYGGITFSESLVFTWGVVGTYVFSLTAAGILLTTCSHFSVMRRHGQTALLLSTVLWLVSLALDPAIWSYQLYDVSLAGQVIRHFDIWAAVWMASWLVPIVAAWLLTQRLNSDLPRSLHRNQVHYWLLVLAFFAAGGILASIRQPGRPVWQEVAMLLIILAGFTGTASISQTHLPDLQLVLRQILSRLSGTLILFGLTWAALRFIVQGVTDLPTDTNPNLVLTLAAALFAGLFIIIYRLVNAITRRLFVPSLARRKLATASYTNAIGNLPEPAQLARLALRIVQSSLGVDDAWFFSAEDGPAGRLILRPLANLETEPPGNAEFDNDSPFANHLWKDPTPLAQLDIDALSTFDVMASSEKALLSGWHRVLYVPLRTGGRLVGVLGLGERNSGESYERGDIELLESLATQISPLVAQAQNLASLRQINDYVFQQNQALALKNQHLTELASLHAQFIQLISPELRQPFASINKQLHQIREASGENSAQQHLIDLQGVVGELRARIDRLIAMSAQLETRGYFHFQPVRLDEVASQAMRNLKTMTEARRVHIELEQAPILPAVHGDEQQLREAVQHILHNAIKFSKIGGRVELKCTVEGGHVCLRVVDGGVGIPGDRLEKIWAGLVDVFDGDSHGSGLGLVLARFIIAAHGGYMKAQSSYGAGSTFSIHLPMMVEGS